MGKAVGIAVAIVVVVIVVGVAMALNYLPNPLVPNVATQYPNSSVMVSDVSWLSNVGVDPETIDMLDELNIRVYGIDGVSADSVVSWYESRNARNGWSVVPEVTGGDSGIGWRYYTRGWQKGLMGQLILFVGGIAVRLLRGYDTIVITSSALMSTYERIFGG